MRALPGGVGEGWGRRAPQDHRRRGAGASPPGPPGAPRAHPPTHPPRCSYVLVVTVALRLVLEPGPAARAAAAAAARRGRRSGRLGSEGLGPRAVLLGPLAAQEAARLRGRREGPRGVDLAREPLVQRSHRSPRALAGCLWGVLIMAFPLSGSRSPPPPGEKGEKERRRRKEGRTAAARPLLPRATLKSPPGDWLSLPRPLPRRLGGAGVWGCVLSRSSFLLFNSLPWPRTA